MMKKNENMPLLVMIALIYTTICMETDIYVPAFPDMKEFFSTTANGIQLTLSINFIGICLGSLLFGPLSDSFGRQKIMRYGLMIFAISSWGCVIAHHFTPFLFCRFIQGVGAAIPMVVSFAMLLEKYNPDRVAQVCGGLNIFITAVMSFAPILGSFLNLYYGWHANFLLIASLATVSWVGSYWLIPETLPIEKRLVFSWGQMIKNYVTVLMSFPFMAASFVCYLLFAGLVMYASNLSLIFIEYLGVSKSSYGFYQASAPATFALFSLLSIWIIEYFGTQVTKYLGLIIACVGTAWLMMYAVIEPQPIFICAAMALFTAGITLAVPIYGMEAANVYPEMRGIATGMSNALRHIIVAAVVGIGGFIFDGSIRPVVLLIMGIMIITIPLALTLIARNKVSLKQAVSI